MVKLNKIYTRTGDDGTSGLVDGSRLPKSDALFAAIGDVDEANSAIGVAVVALGGDHPTAKALTIIQNDLFDLGADLATPPGEGDEPFAPAALALRVTATQVARLEAEIDAMNENLAPLTSFILPGGSEAAARLHVARSTTRITPRVISGALSIWYERSPCVTVAIAALAGVFIQAGMLAWPLILGGVLKIVYDVLLLIAFRHVKPPEEKA